MSKTFTTPKGTVLPLLNLKGKDYLQVAHRLVWFNETFEHFDISTRILNQNPEQDGYTLAESIITIFEHTEDKKSAIVRKVNGYKMEHKAHFSDHVEKATTGSIGRALALIGIGTQFAEPDLDEGTRIVDAPLNIPKKSSTSSFRKSTATSNEDFA